MVAALFLPSEDLFPLYSLKGYLLEFMRKASRGIVQELCKCCRDVPRGSTTTARALLTEVQDIQNSTDNRRQKNGGLREISPICWEFKSHYVCY